MQRILITILLILLALCEIKTQNAGPHEINHYSAEKVFPQAPEAAKFTRYGQYPVNLSTGLVDISIPIYTIKSKQLELPITLAYHLSGIKVEEVASNVGLGWTLNAGGVISIQVKGIRGDVTGTYRAPKAEDLDQKTDVNNLYSELRSLCYSDKTQSDFFSYNISNGVSGSFFYNNEGKIIQVPQSDNKVELIIRKGGRDYMITADNGNKYIFKEEHTIKTSDRNTVAFNLSKIVSADGKDSIVFSYSKKADFSEYPVNFTAYLEKDTRYTYKSMNRLKKYDIIIYNTLVLDKITFSGGEVLFTYSTDRKDRGTARLNKIQVNQTLFENTAVKKKILECRFLQSYFVSGGTPSNDKYTKFYYRLKLNGIELHSSIATEKPQTYKFSYNSTMLPHQDYLGTESATYYKWGSLPSYSQDLWGYYNGAYNNQLIPYDGSVEKEEFYKMVDGGYPNREASENHAKACSLEKITYPTGGSTFFETESNRLFHKPNSLIGGLRIKRIRSYDRYHNLLEEKEYEYISGAEIPINNYTFKGYFYKQKYEFLDSPSVPPGQNPQPNQSKIIEKEIYTSTPFTFQPVNYAPIFYSLVREYLGNKNYNEGYKLYEYDLVNNQINYMPGYGNSMYARYKASGTDEFWRRGNLLEESVYKKVGKNYELIQKTKNEYELFNSERHIIGIIVTNDHIFETNMMNQSNPKRCFHWFNTYTNTGVKKLRKTTITNYVNGKEEQEKIITYDYDKITETENKHQQLSRKSIHLPDGEELITRYKYPLDYNFSVTYGNDYQVNKKFRDANIKTVPLEILKQVKYSGSTKTISGVFNKYKDINQLEKLYKLETATPLSYEGATLINANGYDMSDKYQLESEFKYDSENNLKEYTVRGNPPVHILWSYNSLYPIAEIRNTSLSNLQTALSSLGLTADNLLKTANPDMGKVDLLRSKLPDAAVTTYTYYPLRGRLSSKDPNEISTSYQYDGFGRLVSTKNHKQEYLQKYEYKQNPASHDLVLYAEYEYEQFRKANFNVQVEGGSGQYTYKWTLKDVAGNIIAESGDKAFSIIFPQLGEMRLECRVTDSGRNKTIETARTFKVIPPPPLEASEISCSAKELRLNGKGVTFQIEAKEGSLNYTYNWVIKTPTKTVTGNKESISTTFEEHGDLTVTCTVYDPGTKQTVVKELKSYVLYPLPLELERLGQNIKAGLNYRISYGIYLKDGTGSGNFTYTWKVTTPTKTVTDFPSEKQIFYTLDELGTTYVSCTARDNYTGESKMLEKEQIVKYTVDISNPVHTQQPEVSKFIATAEINSLKDMTITVEIGIDRENHPSNDAVYYTIASTPATLWSGKTTKKVTLKAGKNRLEIQLRKDKNINQVQTAWIKIIEVPSDFTIGKSDNLTLRAL